VIGLEIPATNRSEAPRFFEEFCASSPRTWRQGSDLRRARWRVPRSGVAGVLLDAIRDRLQDPLVIPARGHFGDTAHRDAVLIGCALMNSYAGAHSLENLVFGP